MNAYELADELRKMFQGEEYDRLIHEIPDVLRQQADRIAELEKQDKPVAWMEYIQDEEWEVWYTEPTDLPEGHSYKPLYLAPQTKPLSDEEIKIIATQNRTDLTIPAYISFARAIEERHGIK